MKKACVLGVIMAFLVLLAGYGQVQALSEVTREQVETARENLETEIANAKFVLPRLSEEKQEKVTDFIRYAEGLVGAAKRTVAEADYPELKSALEDAAFGIRVNSVVVMKETQKSEKMTVGQKTSQKTSQKPAKKAEMAKVVVEMPQEKRGNEVILALQTKVENEAVQPTASEKRESEEKESEGKGNGGFLLGLLGTAGLGGVAMALLMLRRVRMGYVGRW